LVLQASQDRQRCRNQAAKSPPVSRRIRRLCSCRSWRPQPELAGSHHRGRRASEDPRRRQRGTITSARARMAYELWPGAAPGIRFRASARPVSNASSLLT
jgi:hypothetical protein